MPWLFDWLCLLNNRLNLFLYNLVHEPYTGEDEYRTHDCWCGDGGNTNGNREYGSHDRLEVVVHCDGCW